MSFKPTKEQSDIIDAYVSRKSMKVSAYAGTGKTSTLAAMSEARKDRALYLAFNRAIAEEAKSKFGNHVECKTINSVAWHAASDHDVESKKSSINAAMIMDALGIKGGYEIGNANILSARDIAVTVKETVERYCNSGDALIKSHHIPMNGKLATIDKDAKDKFDEMIVTYAMNAWAQMLKPDGKLPLGFTGTVKLFQLNKVQLRGDVVFVDEAQDLSGVMLQIIRQQNSHQIIPVGDQFQQLYAWRGAIDALQKIDADVELNLTKTFRFGPRLAGFASNILQMLGAELPLIGNENVSTRILERGARPHAILCRSNAGVLRVAFNTLAAGQFPHIVGGAAGILYLLQSIQTLMNGKPTSHPDFMGFKNWQEVLQAEQEPGGSALSKFVRLADEFPPGPTIKKLIVVQSVAKENADVIISNGHQAKGLEWGRVELTDDFLVGIITKEDGMGGREVVGIAPDAAIISELKLLYVAATRAIDELIVPPLLADKLAEVRRCYGPARAA